MKFTFTRTLEHRIILALSVFALIMLLLYTGVHTANVLARYVQPAFIGWLAAFGIELTIALMAWRLARGKGEGKLNIFIIGALLFALFVSMLANVDEGYRINYQDSLQIANLGQLDVFQGIVGLAVTGLIPVLVFAISEIVGSELFTEVEQSVKSVQVERTPVEQPKQWGARELAKAAGIAPATASKVVQALNGK